MTKYGKRVYSDWTITTHTVNSYKNRVADPGLNSSWMTSVQNNWLKRLWRFNLGDIVIN